MAAMTKSRPRGTLITRKARHLEAATSASRRFELLPDGEELPHPQTRIGLSPIRCGDDDEFDGSREGAVGRRTFKAKAVRRGCGSCHFEQRREIVWHSQIERPRS